MDPLTLLCGKSIQFPQNLPSSDIPDHLQDTYHDQINKHEERLFTSEKAAALTFWELGYRSTAFWEIIVTSADGLRAHLGLTVAIKSKPDPRCRFLFVRATTHSRSSLKTTRAMLMLSFTYLQVMPEFLDFLFLFGKQTRPEDLYCSGFRQKTHLGYVDDGMKDSSRNWSGCDLQVCYSLKSIEHSDSQTERPWSIRHCAVHHGFDAKNVRSTWVMMKGDDLIERRIKSATSLPKLSSFQSTDRAFAAALAIHLILCDWSAENWRWYIRFLENKFEELTEGTISRNPDAPMAALNDTEILKPVPRTDTGKTFQSAKSRASSLARLVVRRTRTFETMSSNEKESPTSPRKFKNSHGKLQPFPPGKRPNQGSKVDEFGQRVFSFSDLQHIQDTEEKTNEAVLILKLNMNVVLQLKHYYKSIIETEELPMEIRKGCKWEMLQFERRIDGIANDFDLQILRADALLRSLRDRKTLLYGLLDFQNTQANRVIAAQSRRSTQKMEAMTGNMSEIALKTKTETVSMKIITLVTLFFLPGTFISTLMSTDIVHWVNGVRNYQPEALNVYLYISLPFMFLTFLAWAIFQAIERRKENKLKLRHDEAMEKPNV